MEAQNCTYWTSNTPVLLSLLEYMVNKSKYSEINSKPASDDNQLKAIVSYTSTFPHSPTTNLPDFNHIFFPKLLVLFLLE